MLSSLLPAEIRTCEVFGNDRFDAVLWAEEAALVARAVPTRRQEFAATRSCARSALAALGHEPVPIGAGPRREPLWPTGVVGSLTHCEGYRAAAVASASRIQAVGIDAEVHTALPPGVLEATTSEEERRSWTRLARDVHWGVVAFSAKESVYKAWYPLMQRWLDFDQAHVTVCSERDGHQGRLRVTLFSEKLAGLTVLNGRFLVVRGLVATAIWLEREQ